MSPTKREIARKTGVKQSDVSRAINHLKAVNPEMFEGPFDKIAERFLDEEGAIAWRTVLDLPEEVAATIVDTLAHMGENERCHTNALVNLAKRVARGNFDSNSIVWPRQGE